MPKTIVKVMMGSGTIGFVGYHWEGRSVVLVLALSTACRIYKPNTYLDLMYCYWRIEPLVEL